MRNAFRALALTVALALGTTATAGCWGSYKATTKLYNWNKGVGDKFVNTIVMWAMLVIPVYPVFFLGDWWIFNTLEFWTGENPISANDVVRNPDGSVSVRAGDHVYVIVPDGEDDARVFVDGVARFAFHRGPGAVVATDLESGAVRRIASLGVERSIALAQ